jgi:zinc/manganese transport system substrate-binding protein
MSHRVVVFFALAGITSAPAQAPARERIGVVATLPDLAALAAAVGGERVAVTALCAATQDPHYVDPRPDLMLRLNHADLLIVNGLELEVGWLPPLVAGARNPRVLPGAPGHFDASAHVRVLETATAPVDRSMGDVHPGGNPHVTFDPRNAARIARALAARLTAIDPSGAETWRRNAERLGGELDALAGEWTRKFAALPPEKRRVVQYHKSLTYLFDWLGIEQVATVEPKPGIPPDPGHVANVLGTMRATGARVVVQEVHYTKNTSATLARLAAGELIVVCGGTKFDEGERYVDHIRELANRVYEALAR